MTSAQKLQSAKVVEPIKLIDNFTPRNEGKYHSKKVLGDGSGLPSTIEETKVNTPLYFNVYSKIGSGVNQPYNYQANPTTQQAKIKSQIQKENGIQKSRRIRLGPSG